MQVEVEGDGPHDDEPRVQVLDLPRHRPARPGRGAALQSSNQNQSMKFAKGFVSNVDRGNGSCTLGNIFAAGFRW